MCCAPNAAKPDAAELFKPTVRLHGSLQALYARHSVSVTAAVQFVGYTRPQFVYFGVLRIIFAECLVHRVDSVRMRITEREREREREMCGNRLRRTIALASLMLLYTSASPTASESVPFTASLAYMEAITSESKRTTHL